MLTDPTDFASLDAHADYRTAVPTPDHFIPALYLAGLAGAAGDGAASVLVDGYAYGSLSMTAYTLGLDCASTDDAGGAPAVPDGVPPDGSNI
jgi:4,5-DOPA dioxygenase extradiol